MAYIGSWTKSDEEISQAVADEANYVASKRKAKKTKKTKKKKGGKKK